ncbi:MAG: hypothetical protein KC656_33430, partial [Myxococcales bacterium]|nr:hypothetical protein [Myxococcales bacterium]
MNHVLLPSLGLLLLAPTAFAQADLEVTITPPSTVPTVYDVARYEVTVANDGRRNASDVELVVQLPETHTSPQVYTLAMVDGHSSACAAVGTTLVCDLGTLRKRRSATVWVDLALPYSSEPMVIEAHADTSSGDSNPTNDDDVLVAQVAYVPVALTAPQAVTNAHCTGVGLTSFYECLLFPSSLTAHPATLLPGGVVDLSANGPGVTGQW